MKPIITYEEFESYIDELKSIDEFQTKLDTLITSYNNSGRVKAEYIHLPTLFDSMIELLQKATGDTSEYISFWVYELDFGRKYKDGCVQRENGESVPLKTTMDLWKKIIENWWKKDIEGSNDAN